MVRETSPVILVVEDDTAVRLPLVKFLQMRQYTVVTAETADEGLDAIQLTAENLRAALEAAHVFDVRAIRDALKVALGELDRAEQRVVRESGLEVALEE